MSDLNISTEAKESYDSVIKNRRRWSRIGFFIVSLLVSLVFPGLIILSLANIVFDDLGSFTSLIMLFGAMFGGTIFSNYLPKYIVSVPQVQGFVTVNKLKTLLHIAGITDVIYGPGWHISYPWEDRSEKSNFSLEVFTYDFKEVVPGDNTRLIVTGVVQFEAALSNGAHFIGIDELTIEEGAMKSILSKISQDLHDSTADNAKSMIAQENELLMQEFAGIDSENETDSVTEFEKLYAIRVTKIVINSIDLDEDVQKARDAVDKAKQILTGIAEMYGMTAETLKTKLASGDVPFAKYNEMIDRYLAQNGSARMDINAIKLASDGELSSALGPFLLKLTGGDKQ